MGKIDKENHITYIVECADGTLYTGYTKDINRRIQEHNTGIKGAKYTKSRRPVNLRYVERHPSKRAAMKREYFIKKLTKFEKEQLIESTKN